MIKSPIILATISTLLIMVQCAPPQEASLTDPNTLQYQLIDWETPKGSRFPVISAAPDGSLFATWTHTSGRKAPHRLLVAELNGQVWRKPKEVASGKNWFVNWTDTPALAIDGNGILAITYLEKLGTATFAYGIRYTQSSDRGETWSKPTHLQSDLTGSEHGFVSLSARQEGGFDALWLDGRHMPLKSPMSIMAASLDATGQRQPEQSLDLMVCECCSTGLARANSGDLIAVWRDRNKEEIRDINVSIRQSTDGKWTEPRLVHRDNWKMPS